MHLTPNMEFILRSGGTYGLVKLEYSIYIACQIADLHLK